LGRVRWGQERGRGRRSGPSPNAHDGPYVNSDLPECVHSAWVETRTDGTECQIEHVCSTRMEKIEWKSPSLSFFVDISFPHTTAEPRGLSPHDVSRRLSQSGHHRCRWVQDSLFSDRSPSHIAPLHRSFERFKIDRSLQVLPESCRCEISWNKSSRSPRSSETRDWEGFGGGRLNPTGRAFSRVSFRLCSPSALDPNDFTEERLTSESVATVANTSKQYVSCCKARWSLSNSCWR